MYTKPAPISIFSVKAAVCEGLSQERGEMTVELVKEYKDAIEAGEYDNKPGYDFGGRYNLTKKLLIHIHNNQMTIEEFGELLDAFYKRIGW